MGKTNNIDRIKPIFLLHRSKLIVINSLAENICIFATRYSIINKSILREIRLSKSFLWQGCQQLSRLHVIFLFATVLATESTFFLLHQHHLPLDFSSGGLSLNSRFILVLANVWISLRTIIFCCF